MTRTDAMVVRPATVASMEVEEVKLGYAYEVACPYCGFRFTSLPSRARSADPGRESGG